MAIAPLRVITLLSEHQCDNLMALVTACSIPGESGCILVDTDRSTRISKNEKGYVQLKVPFESNHRLEEFRTARTCTNKKVQLHQLVLWMHQQDGQYHHREAIKAAKLEVSHLCHQKNCVNPSHLFPEKSLTNKSRNFCEVVVKINGVVTNICRHVPRCIATEFKISNALEIAF